LLIFLGLQSREAKRRARFFQNLNKKKKDVDDGEEEAENAARG